MSRAPYLLFIVGLGACIASSPTRRVAEPAAAPVATPAPEPEAIDGDYVADMEHELEPESEPEQLPPPAEQPPHPFAELTDEQLETMLLEEPESLGALSLGRPAAGALFGGMVMPDGDQWDVVNPKETWGTPETIEYIKRAINSVNEQFPDTKPLPIGDISDEDGGHLAPHISHQSGRDVDIGYYYTTDDKWYTNANGSNLDLPRTWAFVRAFIMETDVEVMFIDRSVQALLREYAESIGEDDAWLDEVFGGPSTPLRAMIRHEKGHKSHIHVRFYNPVAQESGRRMYSKLLAHKLIKPPTYYVRYKVKRGDTLMRIARRYKTTVKNIKRANRLRTSRIIAGHSYKIPRRGGVTQPKSPVAIPERRLPPTLVAIPTTPPPDEDTRTAEAPGVSSGSQEAAQADRAE